MMTHDSAGVYRRVRQVTRSGEDESRRKDSLPKKDRVFLETLPRSMNSRRDEVSLNRLNVDDLSMTFR
ncbi:hypothetical protein QPK87_30290 [Kamptonema cortianum]|nr:hypothetical protein [Kamptonema cortianum]